MIIGLVEPGQGEKLRRNNKKKAAGEKGSHGTTMHNPEKKKIN